MGREGPGGLLTDSFEHLVALVEDEVADGGALETLVADEGVEATGGADDDVGALVLVLEQVLVDLDARSAVEDAGANAGHVLAEAGVLVLDLVGELARVAEDDDGDFTSDRLNLLEGSGNEDGGLS